MWGFFGLIASRSSRSNHPEYLKKLLKNKPDIFVPVFHLAYAMWGVRLAPVALAFIAMTLFIVYSLIWGVFTFLKWSKEAYDRR